ncbi:hypothetical protein D1BOALGB6SA_6804 [Olavius sp. associated proteobacterium Delta 1]|nr:hypothetical protein D1BOALGB6SA_6804 [Olavius sp. associated proteobacterium Delta 1]
MSKTIENLRTWAQGHQKHVYLGVIFFLGVCSIIATAPIPDGDNGITITEKFFLAYAESSTAKIRARWSNDGITWQDGNFPNLITSSPGGNKRPGIGAATNDTGSIYLTVFNKSNGQMGFPYGLGPATWDTTHNEAYAGYSAPAVAYVGNNHWMVVTQTAGSMSVGIYNDNATLVSWSPLGGWAAGADARVRDVEGRATVTVKDGKVLIAWRWYPGSGDVFLLLTSTADIPPASYDTWAEIQSYWGNEDIWTDIHEIPLPFSTEFAGGIESAPDAAHDQNNFYLAFIREESSVGGGLHSWRPVVYSSPDGINWSFHSSFVLDVVINSFINIAAKSDGTMIAAAINKAASSTSARISASRFNGSNWLGLTDSEEQNMFGASRASGIQFALIGVSGT